MNQLTQRIIPNVTKKIDDAHVIWFINSKSFVLLEELDFFVFNLYINGKEAHEIKSACIKKHIHSEKNIPQFVDEIIGRIKYYNNPENAVVVSPNHELLSEQLHFPSYSIITYQLGKKCVSIEYGNKHLKHTIHPLFTHLETEAKQVTENNLELFETNDLLVFKYNGNAIKAFYRDDISFFKGAVLQQIYSIIYNRDFNHWMMTLHASGVTRGNEAVLFSGSAGSGKSTLAALLQANGYQVLSDDFIAADLDGYVHSFPSAISVKTGSLNALARYYPELPINPPEKTFNGKEVRYIPVNNSAGEENSSFNVKAFVFVKFVTPEKVDFKEVNKKEAIRLLLKEAWVKPEPKNVSNFFNWIEQTHFYRLHYYEAKQAIKFIEKLFLA